MRIPNVVIICPNIGTERMSDPRAARVRGAGEEGLNNQVVPLIEPRRSPAMPGMLRKSTAFVPRYQKFESISLQQRASSLDARSGEPSPAPEAPERCAESTTPDDMGLFGCW